MDTVLLWPILEDRAMEGNISCAVAVAYAENQETKRVTLKNRPIIVNVKKGDKCSFDGDLLVIEIAQCHNSQTTLYAVPSHFEYVLKQENSCDAKGLISLITFSAGLDEHQTMPVKGPGKPIISKFLLSTSNLALQAPKYDPRQDHRGAQLVKFFSRPFARFHERREGVFVQRKWVAIILVLLILVNAKRLWFVSVRVVALVMHSVRMMCELLIH